ncbi:MAG: prepilin-type N-terminal cleavage/methylation domain-containing protein [Pyrinomonadaceae bacterium]
MATSTSNRAARRQREAGFTLLEMAVAMVVLFVGLVGVASVISYGLMVTNRGRGVTNTKLLIVSVLEQMEMLRNTKQLSFNQIANVGEVDNTGASREFGGFPTQALTVSKNPGPDGIYGTGDDLVDAGRDNTFGTSDDFENPALAHSGYTRRIVITPLSANLKRIEVTLSYPAAGGEHTLSGVSYLNNDARSSFVN